MLDITKLGQLDILSKNVGKTMTKGLFYLVIISIIIVVIVRIWKYVLPPFIILVIMNFIDPTNVWFKLIPGLFIIGGIFAGLFQDVEIKSRRGNSMADEVIRRDKYQKPYWKENNKFND